MRSLRRGLTLALAALAIVAVAPAAAGATIVPNPYSTTAGSGAVILGTAFCSLSGVTADAIGTATGASGSVSGFTASGCTGIVGLTYVSRMAFTVSSGAVTMSVPIRKRNIYGGTCEYIGTMAGSVPLNGSTLTVSGTLALVRTIAGICTPQLTASLVLVLPGASITW